MNIFSHGLSICLLLCLFESRLYQICRIYSKFAINVHVARNTMISNIFFSLDLRKVLLRSSAVLICSRNNINVYYLIFRFKIDSFENLHSHEGLFIVVSLNVDIIILFTFCRHDCYPLKSACTVSDLSLVFLWADMYLKYADIYR